MSFYRMMYYFHNICFLVMSFFLISPPTLTRDQQATHPLLSFSLLPIIGKDSPRPSEALARVSSHKSIIWHV